MGIENPKSKIGRWAGWVLALAAGAGALLTSSVAWGQLCPLCYRAAAASKAGAVQALRSGVLILMIPPVLIFGAVTLMAIRGRDRFNNEEEPSLADEASVEPVVESATEEDHAWN